MTQFDSFILLAEMRTGSNFLEDNINQIDGLRCWGEAFNPYFTGGAGQTELAGISMAQREKDPFALLSAMRQQTDGLAGFRFFHDHDARVLERLLPDPRCAKIVLTRNPLESYVSLKIARETNQWRLSDMKSAKTARIRFDPEEFRLHVSALQAFQLHVLRALQTTGQTAFYIAYEDAGDPEVLNGLASFLGARGRVEKLDSATKVQNPGTLRDKVENYDEMVEALGPTDHFDLGRTPTFEPRRGPAVPSYVGAARAPLIYLPVSGGPTFSVERWMAALDGVAPEDLGRDRDQKDLRKWKRQTPGHRSFTILRHPVARLYTAFCRRILIPGPECFTDIRATLRNHYHLPLPADAPGADWTADAHRKAFIAFAGFVKGNLGGQTGLRVDPDWASQAAILQGIGQFAPPDHVLRENEAAARLAELAGALGLTAPGYVPEPDPAPMPLAAIYDENVEAAVKAAYQRDYMMFGFERWA